MVGEEELDELIRFYEADHADEAGRRWRTLFDPAAAGPVALIHRLRLRDRARYEDGRPATGLDALMAYATTSVPALARVGGRFLVSSPVVAPLFGTRDDTDLVVVGWYPDRRALLDLLRDPDYRAAFVHRRAAVAEQWVVAASASAG